MGSNRKEPTPLERLMRLGWDTIDAIRRNEPQSLEQIAQNALGTVEAARKGIFNETALKTFAFDIPTDQAVTANVELELSVGESRINALESPEATLMHADLTYLGSLSFGVSGEAQRHVYLRQSTPMTVGWVNPIHWTTKPRWEIGLSKQLPMDLRVQGGVGDANLNLTGVKIQSLRVDGNIGPMNITLPASGPVYHGMIRGAAGPIAINIPNNATASLDVRGGLGGLAVNIAPGAAVQINVQGGVGHTIMTPGFNRMEATAPGLPNTGVWQTPDFDLATRRVTLNLAEGMVGNISVRVMSA